LASDDYVEVNAQTLRRWMLSAGLWSRARKRRVHRKRRERKEHVGGTGAMDGSFHEWLEGRGPRGCLDEHGGDASGDTLARLGSEETIWAAAGVLRAWIKKYGIPVALYTDLEERVRSRSEQERTVAGGGAGDAIWSDVPTAGIGIIAANSPEAKGRVERNHGNTPGSPGEKNAPEENQDPCGGEPISGEEYLPEPQSAVSANPGQPEDYHRTAPRPQSWKKFFHLETGRVIGNDWGWCGMTTDISR